MYPMQKSIPWLFTLMLIMSSASLHAQKSVVLALDAGPAFTGSGDLWGGQTGLHYERQGAGRWAWNTGYQVAVFKDYFTLNNRQIPYYTDYCHQIGANLVYFPLQQSHLRIALTGGFTGNLWHRNYAREVEIYRPDVYTLGYEVGPRFDWLIGKSWICSLSAFAQNDLDDNPIGSIQLSLGRRW